MLETYWDISRSSAWFTEDKCPGVVAKANRKSTSGGETPAERLMPEQRESNVADCEAVALTDEFWSLCGPLQT